MKKLILASLLTICTLLTMQVIAAEKSLDHIAAIVNDDVITDSELDRAVQNVKIQIAAERLSPPAPKKLRNQVLDQLINKKLQLQIAEQAKITISETEVDQFIKKIAKENNMSLDAFYKRVNEEGIPTKKYRRDMHDQLLLQKLQQQEVINRITITPQEIDSYLNSRAFNNSGTKEYHVEDILIPVTDNATQDEKNAAKTQALTVKAALKEGKHLAEIAASFRNTNHPLQSEDLEWKPLSDLPSLFAQEVVHMKTNELAGPLEAGNGYHLLNLKAVRITGENASRPSRKEVENLLLQRKFAESVQNWLSKLRHQAYIVKKSAQDA